MQKQNYLPEARRKISDAIFQNTANNCSITSHRFNLVSANLLRFMPHICFDQHRSIFAEIMLHNQLTHYEQRHVDVLNSITVENASYDPLQLMRTRPCIISSFHFGMYRLMNLFLTKNKIPYTIIIPKESFLKEGHIIKDIYYKINNDVSEDAIRFIEMESPTLSLKMIRELKEGRSLFIYFDGYRGAGSLQENKRYREDGQINFLGKPILARVGVAYIAQMAGVPLITGISYRKSLNDLRLKFFDPVFPDTRLTRDQFAHDITQKLYDEFGTYLTSYPGQWEAWLYLHRSLPSYDLGDLELFNGALTSNVDEQFDSGFQINHKQFGFFKIQDKTYLFNKKTYTTYPIEEEVFDWVEKAIGRQIDFQEKHPLIQSLIEHKIIIPVAA